METDVTGFSETPSNICQATRRHVTEHVNDLGNCHLAFRLLWRCCLPWVMASSFLRFLGHKQRGTTVGRTSLDLYLTSHNTHQIETSMSSAGFENVIPKIERP